MDLELEVEYPAKEDYSTYFKYATRKMAMQDYLPRESRMYPILTGNGCGLGSGVGSGVELGHGAGSGVGDGIGNGFGCGNS